MTPKEKALELCNRFMICNSYQSIVWHNARICALIAVDEIIKQSMDNEYTEKYWKQVKEEINKL